MIWAGSPFAQRIEFSTGLPTGAVSFRLLGNNGTELVSDDITPVEGSLSALILIGGEHNSCSLPLFENRTLLFNYVTADGLVTDRVAYRVQRQIPFAAAADGVRLKLGIEQHEVKDTDIDLVSAYAELLAISPDDALTIYETSGDRTAILIIHAIEALAALLLIASLQIKVAQRESSDSNEYQRFANADWKWIEADLLAHVARARAAIDPGFDGVGGTVFTFGSATRPDPFTGES